MKSNFDIRSFALVALCSVALVGCGGGDGESSASGGIGGTGVAYGTVTDFGSIVVNGRHLDDSAASVKMDDNPSVSSGGNHGGLKKGMVVRVSGDIVSGSNAGTATNVTYRDSLEGPVCALSTTGGITMLRVLGQTVRVDATTHIHNNSAINVGNVVEVSGLPDVNEIINATYIENKTLGGVTPVIEVKGHIDAVAGSTVTINALNVTIDGGTVIDNSIPGGTPAVGQYVEVKGSTYACGVNTDTLTATRIELESEGAGTISSGSHAEVEGIVSSGNASSFFIGGQQVVTNGSTRYLPQDFGPTDIVLGTKLEAEGTVSGNVLTASKISFRANVKIQSAVATVGTTSFTLHELGGITVQTNLATEFNTGLAPNASVRVRGIEGPNNTVLATRIDSGSGGGATVFLQGPVDTKVGTVVTILGIPVNASGLSYRAVDDSTIGNSADFLSLIQPGTLVKFKGVLSGGSSPTWQEGELED